MKELLKTISKYIFTDVTLFCKNCGYKKEIKAEEVLFVKLHGNYCPKCKNLLIPTKPYSF